MGRQKKYKTKKALENAVEKYFRSISRTVVAKEEIPSGECNSQGKPVLVESPILNDDGEEIMVVEYLSPPSIGALCLFLGISRQTWARYCEEEAFLDTTTRARARVECYLEEQLILRQKGVQGIIFNLQNNYGWREKREVELGEASRTVLQETGPYSLTEKQELIREIMTEFGAGADGS